jgi:hypothetical protein
VVAVRCAAWRDSRGRGRRAVGATEKTHICATRADSPARRVGAWWPMTRSRSGARCGRATAGSLLSTSQSTRSSSSSSRNERVSRSAASACCASADVLHEGNMCSHRMRRFGWTNLGAGARWVDAAKSGSRSQIAGPPAAIRIALRRRDRGRRGTSERSQTAIRRGAGTREPSCAETSLCGDGPSISAPDGALAARQGRGRSPRTLRQKWLLR